MSRKKSVPQVIVRSIGEGTQLQMVTTTGKHSYVMDEPEIRGGNDLGAAPFELFIAGYGGWSLLTLLGVAKANSIVLQEVEIHLSFKRSIQPKFHKDYHGDPERRKNWIVQIVSDIYLKGEVTEEEKVKLLDELQNCPLHNTLVHSPDLVEKIHIIEPSQELPEYDWTKTSFKRSCPVHSVLDMFEDIGKGLLRVSQ